MSLRVFEDGVLREKFGPEREGITEEWKRWRSEDVDG
jgi:hypothetical protein